MNTPNRENEKTMTTKPSPRSRLLRQAAVATALSVAMVAPATIASAQDAPTGETGGPAVVAAATDASGVPVSEPSPAPGATTGVAPEPGSPSQIAEPAVTGAGGSDAAGAADGSDATVQPADEAVPDPEAAAPVEPAVPAGPAEPVETAEAGAGASLASPPAPPAEPVPTIEPAQLTAIPTRAIVGTARDVFGTPVFGAVVSLVGEGIDVSVFTASNGTFALPEVPVGTYQLISAGAGLVPFERIITLVPGAGPEVVDPEYAYRSILSGTVSSAQTFLPLPGMTVSFEYADGRAPVSTQTAADGTWAIELDPGEVQVSFQPPSGSAYAREWFQNSPTKQNALTLTLPEIGTAMPGVDAQLDQARRILGHVSDGLLGVENAEVVVVGLDGVEVASALTDASGHFATSGLVPGDYLIRAAFDGRHSAELPVTVGAADDLVGVELVLEFEDAVPPPPTPHDDAYTTQKNTLLQVLSPGLLVNDTPSEPVDNELHVAAPLVVEPVHGEVIVSSDGSFVYQPDDGFVGLDTFVYEVADYGPGTAPALVTIEVVDDGDGTEGGAGGDSGSGDGDEGAGGSSAGSPSEHDADAARPSGSLASTGWDSTAAAAGATFAALLLAAGSALALARRRIQRRGA
jgi:hypothetical protein